MKPNLFRSISDSLAESFPIVPRIRRSFIGLLMFAILLLLIQFTDFDNLHVRVKPASFSIYENKTITNYFADTVKLNGEIILAHPTVLQKILLTDAITHVDPISLFFIAVISIIIIRITPKIYQHHLFRKDISASIRLIGYLLIFHALLSIYRTIAYAPNEIMNITHNEFTVTNPFPIFFLGEMYTALIVIAIGSAYKRGIQLQEEQDLTV